MELLQTAATAQVLYPVAAVAVVLICAALVFVFGFHSAEQPQFDKLPIIVDDRKSGSKKRKTKEKKSSPNRVATEDVKTKSESKKSPAKEKKEEKVKEAEKPKPKPAEPKVAKKEVVEAKKGKKAKNLSEADKPADFDEGLWEEVPKKSEKKVVKKEKVKAPEEGQKKEKDSPVKKNKGKKLKEADVEAAQPSEEPVEEKVKILSVTGPVVDEEADRALQAQIEEVQRILKEAERREQAALNGIAIEEEEVAAVEKLTDVKDLRSDKKKENKEKQKKKASETVATKNVAKPEAEKDTSEGPANQEEAPNTLAFDEIGDSWTDAKAPKKSKKKARKDQ